MTLAYPNARLFIYNLLKEGESDGGQAIVRGAYEFSLIDPGSLDNVLLEKESNYSCRCLWAAQNVITRFFEEKNDNKGGIDRSQRITQVLSDLKHDIKTYHRKRDIDLICRGERGHREKICGRFAPVVFDLMLQQLSRYA